MKKLLITLSALLLIAFTAINAQDAVIDDGTQTLKVQADGSKAAGWCGTMDNLEMLKQQDPGLEARMQDIETATQKWIAANQDYIKNSKTVITIPVVVHIVWNTSAQNISDQRVRDQIAVLNQDYGGTNSDTNLIPTAFHNLHTGLGIQFCLAKRTPSGNSTTGIERRQTTVTSFTSTDGNKVKFNAQGGLDAWDNNKYMNIWVCNLGNSLLGYAQFPGGNPATDGVVILYSAFGTTGTSYPYNKGRTTTHEFGHCFNLRHIWGDDAGACTGTDFCADTPNQADANYGCPTYPHVTCSNSGDMSMNYMDYVDDRCMYMFTFDQKARVLALFAPGGLRYQLTQSNGCDSVAAGAPIADFNASTTTPALGTTVSFTDASSNNPTTWSWVFQGGTPATSNVQNPTVTYNTQGNFDVTLTVTNANGTDTKTKTGYIVAGGGAIAWVAQNTGFSTASRGIDQICILNPSTVWAKAYDGANPSAYIREFTRTNNGGATWHPGTFTFTGSTSFGCANIFPISYDTAYAAMFPISGTGGKLIKTVNGGTTWTIQTTANFTGSWLDFVHFFDRNNGVCVGDPKTSPNKFVIYTTSDGGNNWVAVPAANIPLSLSGEAGIVNFYDAVGNTIWFGTGGTTSGRIFKSTDKGLTWTVSATGLTDQTCPIFKDANTGIAVSSGTNGWVGMKKTTDGGTNWQTLTPTGAFQESTHIAYVPGTAATWVSVSGGAPTGSTYSINDCSSFINIDTASNQYVSVGFYDINTGWAGGFNQSATVGGIYKWNNVIPGNNVNFSGTPTSFEAGQSVNFTDLSNPTPVGWLWSFPGGTPSTSTSQNPQGIVYGTAGNYDVTLTAYFTNDTLSVTKTGYIQVSGVGVTSLNNNNNIEIAVSNNLMKISYNMNVNNVSVYDILGKQIANVNCNNSDNSVNINITNYKSGVYFVKINSDNNQITRKISIVK